MKPLEEKRDLNNRLMLQGFAGGLTLISIGALVWLLRIGGAGFQLLTHGAGELLAITGLLTILAHRPVKPVAVVAKWTLSIKVVMSLAYFAGRWPEVTPWVLKPWVYIPSGAILPVLETCLLLRMGSAAREEGLTECGSSLRRTGWVWFVVQGIVSLTVFCLSTAHVESPSNLTVMVSSPLIPCGLWLVYAIPSVMGLMAAQKLRNATGAAALDCANCGFSLVGLRDWVCPECGMRQESIRENPLPPDEYPPVEPRPKWRGVTGAFLLLLFAGGLTYFQNPDNNLTQYKPHWMLRRDLEATIDVSDIPIGWGERGVTKFSTPGAKRATGELVSRIAAGSMRRDQVNELTERALAVQLETEVDFSNWRRVLEALNAAGHLTDDQKARLSLGSFQFRAVAPAKVRAGHPISVQIEAIERAGPLAPSESGLWIKGTSISIGTQTFPLSVQMLMSGGMTPTWRVMKATGVSYDGLCPAPSQVGQYQVDLVVTIENLISEEYEYYPRTQERRFSVPIEVVGESATPPFVGLHDDASRAILRSSLSVSFMKLTGDGSSALTFNASMPGRPCDIVADAYVCIGDQQILLGTTWIEKDIPMGSLVIPPAVADMLNRAPAPIRIRLKPNLDAAWGVIGVNEVWDGSDIYLETQPPMLDERIRPSREEIGKAQQRLQEQPD